MAVDKNLFLYDLTVVASLYNEGKYVKEWIDYHLLAGVEHFYIYDHESTDDLKEVLRPYVERGFVTLSSYPSIQKQFYTFNDAVQKYKFFSRYIAFIDGDEFILPKSNRSIVEVVDEILADKPAAGGLGINWHCFGSNGQETADYSRGVLERFTRRAPDDWSPPLPGVGLHGGNAHIKSIANPRKIKLWNHPHFAIYFEGCNTVNENGSVIPWAINFPVTTEKLAINHYVTKSKEECQKRCSSNRVDTGGSTNWIERFENYDRNEVFDDSILKYRTARQLETGGSGKPVDYLRLMNALIQNLFPATLKNPPPNFFAGKMETFLTCRKLAAFLRENLLDKDFGMALEEASLRAVQKTFTTNLTLADLRLLIDEMPELLTLEYPVVNEIRETLIQILPQVMNIFRVNNAWREFRDLEIFMNMLKAFDFYEHY